MTFTFTPKSDEEINAVMNEALMPDGSYKFKVKSANEKISKSCNPMIELLLGVYDQQGDERNINDYLLSTDKMIFKLKSFCESIGMAAQYASGKLELHEMLDKTGHVLINIQKGSPKADGSGFYRDKNAVKSYVKKDEATSTSASTDKFDDDITF